MALFELNHGNIKEMKINNRNGKSLCTKLNQEILKMSWYKQNYSD